MEGQADSSQATVLRRRRALACEPCRQRKLRCDRNKPCRNCSRSKKHSCYYPQYETSGAAPEPAATIASGQLADRVDRNPQAAPRSESSRPSAVQSSDTILVPTPPLDGGSWYSSSIGSVFVSGQCHGPLHAGTSSGSSGSKTIPQFSDTTVRQSEDHDSLQSRESPAAYASSSAWIPFLAALQYPVRGIMIKGRYFGQSHWVQSVTLVPTALKWLDNAMVQRSESWKLLQSCKSIAKGVKSQRQPKAWTGECGKHMPPKPMADQLLATYLGTFEPLYHIAHVPTLKLEYDHYWQHPTEASTLIVIKIQLCLAIGALFIDDVFSFRALAEQWIHEASMWLATSAKSLLTIHGLQILCLLQLTSQNNDAIHGDLLWISAGTLHHTAIRMGLHIDPSRLPTMSIFEAETRRRLWAAVVELVLQSSIESGSPPLISLDNFNCQPPSNLDDSQLVPDTNVDPVPHAPETFTDTSLQITLGRSLGVRLKVAKFVNEARSQGDYEEVLSLHAELTNAIQASVNQVYLNDSKVSPFQRQFYEMITRRYLLALHLPYMQTALKNPAYYFSRRVCVDVALSLSYAAFEPSPDGDPTLAALHTAAKVEPPCEEYVRLIICGFGMFRSVHFQSTMIIAAELLAIVQSETPGALLSTTGAATPHLSSDPFGFSRGLRSLELYTLLQMAVKRTRKSIIAGLTNVKDYIFTSVILAEIEAVMNRSAPDVAKESKALEAFMDAATVLRNMTTGEPRSDNIPFEDEQRYDEVGDIDGFWIDEFQDIGANDFGLLL